MLGMTLAIIASVLLNVGKGIQKWKVSVLKQGRRAFHSPWRRDLSIWLLGVGMTSSATVVFSFALKYTDKASTVSALNGVGLIGLVLFAAAVLKENVGWREGLGAVLVILGTFVVGIYDTPASPSNFSSTGYWGTLGGLAALYLPGGVISWRTRRGHGLVFGSMAGALIGCAMVMGDVALVAAQGDVLGQLTQGYVYIALVMGTCALAVTNLAFWRSSAMVVVPTSNSFVILTPVLVQYFTFDTALEPMQMLGVGIIVLGVVRLTLGVPAGEGAVATAQIEGNT